MDDKNRAKRIVSIVLDELKSRSGIENIFDEIDYETEKEIANTLSALVEEELLRP